MLRSVSKVFILLTAAFLVGAQGQTPPKELLQYIRDAQKAGQNVFQIQQNAVNSGWPAVTVSEALTYVHDEDAAKETVASGRPASDVKDSMKPAAKPADAGTGGTPAAAALKAAEDRKQSAKPEKVDRGVPDDYEIGAGDILGIDVWKEPDASVKSVVVRTDGKISMPLLHEVQVVGLTPVQLEKLITERLSSLINTPDVTIIVTGTSSKKLYVQGKVKKEGPIPFTYRMTVMQALSEAGGLTDYANKKKIYILRNENGKTFRFPFDYAAVLKGQRLELNIQLRAGDMIVVP